MYYEQWTFKCKEYDSNELYVEYYYSTTEECFNTLPCNCSEEKDFAAQRTYTINTTYRETRMLDDEHHFYTVVEDEKVDSWDEEIGFEVECPKCQEEAKEWDWVTKIESPEIDEDSEEFYVRCSGCDREIEFGWSHPGRGGRIWPAECSDFNPWKCWPEPRYRYKWLERGWIRPDFR